MPYFLFLRTLMIFNPEGYDAAMTESVGWKRDEPRYAEIPTRELLSILGNGPGVFGDIGGLGLSGVREIRKTSEWTHVTTSMDAQVIANAQRRGLRFFYEREPWHLPFGRNYLKSALLKLPNAPQTTQVKRSLEELVRVIQPEGTVVVSTAWGGLQRDRLKRLLARHQFEVSAVLQIRSGVVAEAGNTDDPIMAVARAKWRPWMR